MRRILSSAFVGLVVGLLAPIALAQTVGEPKGSKITEKTGEVSAGGDFSYGVDFAIPKFRGLEPELGLATSRVAKIFVHNLFQSRLVAGGRAVRRGKGRIVNK